MILEWKFVPTTVIRAKLLKVPLLLSPEETHTHTFFF